jgi:hypothetical protein
MREASQARYCIVVFSGENHVYILETFTNPKPFLSLVQLLKVFDLYSEALR